MAPRDIGEKPADFINHLIEKNMITEFYKGGHHFKVIGIENNLDEFIIIRDGRQTKRVKKEIAEKAPEHVEHLFQ